MEPEVSCEIIPKDFVEVTYPSHKVRSQDKFVSKVYSKWSTPITSLGEMLSNLDSKYRCIAPIIPFNGAGKYRLANGRIVNLDNTRSCSKSDEIKSINGAVFKWIWERDGTIDGLFKNISSLYLIEKLGEDTPPVEVKKYIFPLRPKVYYVTKGGYVLYFKDEKLAAEQKYCPGISVTGTRSSVFGWTWCGFDGSIRGLTPEWTEKLQIVEELPCEVIDPPEKWKYADGYIQFRKPKIGEYYISSITESPLHYSSELETINKWNGCRFIIEKENVDKKTVPSQNAVVKIGGKEFTGKVTDFSIERIQTDTYNYCDVAYTKYSEIKNKVDVSSSATVQNPEKENIEMKKTAKSVGNAIWRATNYCVVEPAVHIGKPVLKSLRYVAFVSGLAAVGYGCFHPTEVRNAKDAVMSCLPKITITAPEIMK